MDRGAHHGGGVHVREPAQCLPLVAHPVLQTDDGWFGSGGRGQPIERSAGVVALDGEEHDIVDADLQQRRIGHHGDVEEVVVVRRDEVQAPFRHGGAMRAPGDEDHVVAVLLQSTAHHPTHRSGTDDDEPHVRRARSR